MPDGTVLGGDGQPLGKVRPDGMVVGPDGKVLGKMAPDGSIQKAGPGDKLAENTTTRPDGTVLGSDGQPLGKVNKDGLVVDQNGKVLGKMAKDGSISGAPPGSPEYTDVPGGGGAAPVLASNTRVAPDGTVVPPGPGDQLASGPGAIANTSVDPDGTVRG